MLRICSSIKKTFVNVTFVFVCNCFHLLTRRRAQEKTIREECKGNKRERGVETRASLMKEGVEEGEKMLRTPETFKKMLSSS